jgi:hypothetical protein
VRGVSLTNALVHCWHPVADTEFTLVPATTVTDVGAVAEATGMVNVCEISWDFIQNEPPP